MHLFQLDVFRTQFLTVKYLKTRRNEWMEEKYQVQE